MGAKKGLGMMDVVLQTDTGIFGVEQLHSFFGAMGFVDLCFYIYIYIYIYIKYLYLYI